MGVTIHYRFGQHKDFAKSTVDNAERVAKGLKKQVDAIGVPVEIHRENDLRIIVNVGRCESFVVDFQTKKQIEGAEGWSYERETLKDLMAMEPDENMLWTSAFTKTQFADTISEHRLVCELVRSVAMRARYAEVQDEGDYYHSGRIEDAAEAIHENGKMIDGIGDALAGAGFDSVRKGGETKVKPSKKGV